MAPVRLLPHVALTALLAGLLVALPTTAPAAAAGSSSTITSGSVVWGLKDSWRSYIGDGSEAGDGATVTAWKGTTPVAFRFPVESGSYDPETRTTTLDLAGSVHFRSWYGQVQPGKWALDTTYSDLTVTISPTVQEIRGTHTGYTRDDPGGELHHDVDVVLAQLDVTDVAPTTASGTTTWTDVPAVAGPGFSIYGQGTTLDPVSIEYAGDGGKPDLTERFDRPGVPALREDGRWMSVSTTSGLGTASRALEVSPRGDVVYVAEIAPEIGDTLVVRALDAQTMKPVGRPFEQPVAPEEVYTGRYLRTAIDPATDTLFYVTSRDGDPAVRTTVRSLTFDRGTGTFTSAVVGRLHDGRTDDEGNTQVPGVGSLAWNPVAQELAVLSDDPEATDLAGKVTLFRFSRAGDGWTRSAGTMTLPTTGEYAGAIEYAGPFTSGEMDTDPDLAALGDGSYVLATGTGYGYVDDEVRYLPALHLRPSGDTVAVTPVPGTRHTSTVFGTYYGYTSATPGPDGSVLLHGSGQSIEDYVRVDLVDGVATAREPFRGPDVYPDYGYSVFAASMVYDAGRDLLWATDNADTDGEAVQLVRRDGSTVGYRVPDYATYSFGRALLKVGPDGSLYVPLKKDGFGYARLAFGGITPTVDAQPQDVSVRLGADETARDVTFRAEVSGASSVQWQRRAVGASRFTDVEGAAGSSLTVAASPTTAGSTYRLTVVNDAGTVVSDEAQLTVTYPPRFAVQPRDVRTRPGTVANLDAEVLASPEVTSSTWQRRVDGFWTTVGTDDDDLVVGDTSLTVRETSADQTGSQFRLKVTSSLGTTYSRTATLTVEAPAPQAGTVSGARLEWSGSQELQKAPPFGGSSYFSAGVSDGSEGTYQAEAGSVSVLQLDGKERIPASWATRAAHVDADPGTRQVVTLDDGRGRVEQDGSATIAWSGAWTVNFYGGLVPFTLSDPVLTVDDEGVGRLTADLSGYGSSQENPGEKTPIAPVEDVVVATYRDVEVDPDGFVVEPDYAGVEVDVPAGASAQLRTGDAWGSWPQPFVDFHARTGLTSYWYSSGGAADPDKPPAPITVGAFEVDGTEPVAEPPTILTQPSPMTATVGRQARFAVTASGEDLSYQWQRKVGSSWLAVADADGPTLTLDRVVTADRRATFRVRVANASGTVVSRAVRLDVAPARTAAHVSLSRASQTSRAPASRRALVRVRLTASNGTTPVGTVTVRLGSRKVATARTSGGRATVRLPAGLARRGYAVRATFTPRDPASFTTATSRPVGFRVR